MSTDNPPILYTSGDGIAEIRFNRPERLNVLSREMADAFAEHVDAAITDPSIRVVMFSAEGRAFMAGGDLAYFHGADDRRQAALDLIGPVHGALEKLAASSAIAIGSVRGAVAGAGVSLSLGFDLVVAAADTTFNLAYARIGASPDCGGSWSLPRLVGYRRALEIALLSENIGAEEALRLGLVNRVVAPDTLDAETRALAARLAAGAPRAQGHIKALMRRSLERTYAEQLDAEAAAFCDCAVTDDFGEALSAFFEKRKPRFSQGGPA